jgi:D-alanyl-D-alanine carboxypeptidase
MDDKGFFKMKRILSVAAVLAACLSCQAEKAAAPAPSAVFTAPASIPADLVSRINAGKKEFIAELDAVLAADTDGLLVLVDKKHPLDQGFVPADLVPVKAGRAYVASRDGLSLRASAESALDEMARAAKKDGITLVASSTFRDCAYQKKIYERNVREMGKAKADRESAPPGMSQHQLGTAVDFGSITDDFATTKAGKWLAAHAAEYGWSLSFPKGQEPVTGYRWECWHYRYVGKEAAALQEKWFGGVQQYMIEFIDAWKRAALAGGNKPT